MKFFGGFIVGVVTTILVLLVICAMDESGDTLAPDDTPIGLTMLPEKGECIIRNEVEIFQTIKSNMALAQSGKFPNEILVLLVNYEGEFYYDGKKIKIPVKKCARQIGIYQYTTEAGLQKTVPVVIIE